MKLDLDILECTIYGEKHNCRTLSVFGGAATLDGKFLPDEAVQELQKILRTWANEKLAEHYAQSS